MSDADPLESVFGDEGLLAKVFPGYTKREGQFTFASEVRDAILSGKPLVAEASTGTGKSFGYLVPGIFATTDPETKRALVARRPPPEKEDAPVWIDGTLTGEESPRVLVVTAGLALQDQLVKKDLPFLQRVLPWPFRFQVAKGKSNYLCRDRFSQASVLSVDEADTDALDAVSAWAAATEEGDIAELPLELSPSLRRHLTVSGQECHGGACDYRAECYAYRARDTAGSCEVVVANYQLFFAHLAVVGPHAGSSILPRYDVLILDECQHAESIARQFFGFSVSKREILAAAEELAGKRKIKVALEKEAASFFDRLAEHRRSGNYKARLREGGIFAYENLTLSMRQVAAQLQLEAKDFTEAVQDGDASAERDQVRLRRAAATLKEQATNVETACLFQDAERTVYHLPEEKTFGRETVRLVGEPLEPGGILRGFLWAAPKPEGNDPPRPPPVTIAASATLSTTDHATEEAVRFMANRMGAQGAKCIVVRSPFDIEGRVMTVFPEDAPERADDMGPLFVRGIRASRGRVLGLFTSRHALDAVTAYVRKTLGNEYRILKQGEAPRVRLVHEFRTDIPSCLFGLKSFWAGVDVPGQACVHVMIDKIPFDPPDDPITDAMGTKDKKAFQNYSVPRAIIDLRQAFGRLMRSENDYGVVSLLDRRFTEKGWARPIHRALPTTKAASMSLDDIPAFLARFEKDPTR